MPTTTSIYEPIGRNIGDILAQGTPTGATGTTLDSNILIHPLTDQLKGLSAYIYEGEGAGQYRIITAFAPANNRITVEPAWATIPTANSNFLIFRHFKAEDYSNAYNRAVGKCRLVNLIDYVATTALVATQYEYTVPSGMEWINTLRFVPSSGSDYADISDIRRIFELPSRYWRVERNQGGSYTISLDPRMVNLDDYDGQIIRINGQAKPDFGGTNIPEELQEYIITHASMLMASQRITESQEWRTKFYMFRDETRDLENYVYSHAFGKKVHS